MQAACPMPQKKDKEVRRLNELFLDIESVTAYNTRQDISAAGVSSGET